MVLKECFTILVPVLTSIMNLSLSNGLMPDALKTAALLPTLKKPDADFTKFENFRPISNF